MKTKNLTPFLFGPKVTSRRPPQVEMTLVVRGLFRLRPGEPVAALEGMMEQGALRADEYAAGDDDRRGECLYPGDFADHKRNAEVMLHGTCHSPGGQAVRELGVRFAVGAWSKTLRVVGRRVWTESLVGPAISEPVPFTTLPIGYANAFGGSTYDRNPAGKGYETPELPNVEHLAEPLRSRRDRPEPAGFGPLNPAWPQRSGKVGKDYGEGYRKRRAPFYAEDFDWTYFHAAPADQQLPGYLRGDEVMSFTNLHPSAPSFSAALPGLRIRAFVRSDGQPVREVRMNLDTLFADLDKETVALTWRGLVTVKEDDLKDVRTVLVASELLADTPLPEEHYVQILETFETDPREMKARMPKELLDKMAAAEALAADDAKVANAPPIERASTLVANDRMGAFSEEQKASILEKLAAQAPTAGQHAEKMAGKKPDIAGAVRQLKTRIAGLRSEYAAKNMDASRLDQLEAALADPRLAQHIPGMGGEAPGPEPGPGADLSGRDLSGQDLSDRDLSGANLERASLRDAKLCRTRLVGTNLQWAILTGADLTGADLSGADLSKANLSGARAHGARFDGATLDYVFLEKADLAGASLVGAKAKMAAFGDVDLAGAKAQSVRFFKVFSSKANLEGLDFSGAELVLCMFTESKARGLKLDGATLNQTSFARSDLTGASMVEARGDRSIWIGATLDDADVRHAVLPNAQLMEASAKGTRFYAADLTNAGFYRANVSRAELTFAKLLRANFCKSVMDDARFTGSNLYEAKFLDAVGAGCDFTDANVKRTVHKG